MNNGITVKKVQKGEINDYIANLEKKENEHL